MPNKPLLVEETKLPCRILRQILNQNKKKYVGGFIKNPDGIIWQMFFLYQSISRANTPLWGENKWKFVKCDSPVIL
jgi:hypothetical protein